MLLKMLKSMVRNTGAPRAAGGDGASPPCRGGLFRRSLRGCRGVAQPMLNEIQRRLLSVCPATVPTRALHARLSPDARHGVTVIEDSYESLQADAPRFAPGHVMRLAWLGVFGPPLRAMIEREFAHIARRLASRPHRRAVGARTRRLT